MQNGEKKTRQIMYLKLFSIVFICVFAFFYWPRFDLIATVCAFMIIFFMTTQLDVALADQPQAISDESQQADDGFYYKEEALDSPTLSGSWILSYLLNYGFFMTLPKKNEAWDLIDIGIMACIFVAMLFYYFYFKYVDVVKDQPVQNNMRKKSRHFLYFDAEVLKEVKGRKEWKIHLNQMTSIDVEFTGVWIFYREHDQIKQHHLVLAQWERLPELRQKFLVIKQRL